MRKIGIPFWKTGDNSFGSTLSYVMFAEKFGEVVPLMPNSRIIEDLDLLILPGGADVDPLRYNEAPSWWTGKPDLFKERFDIANLPKYIENGTPVFGICRGHQSLAVHFGGKLIQHMSHETNDLQKDPYSAVHDIKLSNRFRTRLNYTDKITLPVNSRHHQAVSDEDLPGVLQVIARHLHFAKTGKVQTGDGTIEMLAHTNLPVVSMQMHPEDTYDIDTNTFVENVIEYLMASRNSIL